jgi:hypothetical protein
MKRRMITPFLLAIAVLAAVVMLAPTAKHRFTDFPVVHADRGCSNATLLGNYGFTFQGFDIPGADGQQVPFAGAGVLGFNGAGNASISFSATALGGVISLGGTGTGPYTVNSDCSGTITFTTGDAAGETLAMEVVGGGREMLGIATLNTQTITFDAKKQREE